jgi:Ca2+-dependent lipid-binding protein
MLDDGYWPACSTPKARSTQANFNYVGEGFIKELDFSRVWIRLNENDENDKEDVVCELKMEASKFLQTALVGTCRELERDLIIRQNGPTSFTLVNDDGENASAIEIAAKYVPVEIKLMPRESLTSELLLLFKYRIPTRIPCRPRSATR